MKKIPGVLRSLLLLLLAAAIPPLACAAESPVLPAKLLAELDQDWPANRTLNLVFHGHSVPAGYHRTPEVRPFDSYPLLTLQRVQTAHPHAVINSIVTGIGGENSVQGAARFERDVLSMRPDVIFIDYALNDRGIPEDQVEKAWRTMADLAVAKGVPVVFLTPTGAEDVRIGAADDPLERRAALIRRIAAEKKIPVADVWAAWKEALASGVDQKNLLSQINHPNRQGHEIAAQVISRLFETQKP